MIGLNQIFYCLCQTRPIIFALANNSHLRNYDFISPISTFPKLSSNGCNCSNMVIFHIFYYFYILLTYSHGLFLHLQFTLIFYDDVIAALKSCSRFFQTFVLFSFMTKFLCSLSSHPLLTFLKSSEVRSHPYYRTRGITNYNT